MSPGSATPPKFVILLTEDDVLMGRGSPSAEYVGNKRFRNLCSNRRDEYLKCGRRSEKHRISKEIVAEVHNRGGRFLERITSIEEAERLKVPAKTQAWKVIEASSSLYLKVKQLMRDVAPELRQKRKTLRAERRKTSAKALKTQSCIESPKQSPPETGGKQPPTNRSDQKVHKACGENRKQQDDGGRNPVPCTSERSSNQQPVGVVASDNNLLLEQVLRALLQNHGQNQNLVIQLLSLMLNQACSNSTYSAQSNAFVGSATLPSTRSYVDPQLGPPTSGLGQVADLLSSLQVLAQAFNNEGPLQNHKSSS